MCTGRFVNNIAVCSEWQFTHYVLGCRTFEATFCLCFELFMNVQVLDVSSNVI